MSSKGRKYVVYIFFWQRKTTFTNYKLLFYRGEYYIFILYCMHFVLWFRSKYISYDRYTFQISENDILPKLICIECIKKLQAFHEFRKECKKSDNALREHYNVEFNVGFNLNSVKIYQVCNKGSFCYYCCVGIRISRYMILGCLCTNWHDKCNSFPTNGKAFFVRAG